MEERKEKQLKDKVADYRRFGFIMITMSIFLFIGLLIPTEASLNHMEGFMIGAILTLLVLATIFHFIAIKAEKQLFKEDR